MTRYRIDDGIPTLAVALSEHMNASELKKLASLAGGPVPARKAELADLMTKHLEGKRQRAVWQSLDELQKAAVAHRPQALRRPVEGPRAAGVDRDRDLRRRSGAGSTPDPSRSRAWAKRSCSRPVTSRRRTGATRSKRTTSVKRSSSQRRRFESG